MIELEFGGREAKTVSGEIKGEAGASGGTAFPSWSLGTRKKSEAKQELLEALRSQAGAWERERREMLADQRRSWSFGRQCLEAETWERGNMCCDIRWAGAAHPTPDPSERGLELKVGEREEGRADERRSWSFWRHCVPKLELGNEITVESDRRGIWFVGWPNAFEIKKGAISVAPFPFNYSCCLATLSRLLRAAWRPSRAS
jgi:hypothetical protein